MADENTKAPPPPRMMTQAQVAEQNARANQARLSRMDEISRGVDGRRAHELRDVEGEGDNARAGDEFSGGEFREESAEHQARYEAQVREQEEQERRAQESRQEESRRLQAEGVDPEPPPSQEEGEGDPSSTEGAPPAEPPHDVDEQVVGGVRHYKTVVNGQIQWLTLQQLRENYARGQATEEALQRAQQAVQSAAQAELSPKEVPAGLLPREELVQVIQAANLGDEEASHKLALHLETIAASPRGPSPEEIERRIAERVDQRIATKRLQEQAEDEQRELLQHEHLSPVFRQRLVAYANAHPQAKIVDAYRAVGTSVRKDFAPMLSQRPQTRPGAPPQRAAPSAQTKADRKHTIVTPPQSAGRQPRAADDDREVPVSEVIAAEKQRRRDMWESQGNLYRVRKS